MKFGTKTLKEWIPKCDTYWHMVRAEYLQFLLAKIDGSSLSLHSQRARTTKHIPKYSLFELLEFTIGIRKTDPLPAKWKHVPYLVYVVIELAKARGHPADRMLLPPAWNSKGVYYLKQGQKAWLIGHRHLKQEVLLPQSLQTRLNGEAVVFQENYSELLP